MNYISETSNIEKIRICNLKEHTYFLFVSDKVIFGLFEEMPLKLKYNYILPYNYMSSTIDKMIEIYT